MKNEVMLQHLYALQDKTAGADDIEKWIAQLKDDIVLEKCNFVTEKAMLKECRKVLKQGGNKRPVLSKTDMQEINGVMYQVMTDSYFLVALKNPLDLPRVDEGESYPVVSRIIPHGDEIASKIVTFKEINALNKATKKEEGVKLGQFDIGGQEFLYNIAYLLSAFKCLGSNELKLHFYRSSYGFKPFMATPNDNDNGFAVLCPVKRYG